MNTRTHRYTPCGLAMLAAALLVSGCDTTAAPPPARDTPSIEPHEPSVPTDPITPLRSLEPEPTIDVGSQPQPGDFGPTGPTIALLPTPVPVGPQPTVPADPPVDLTIDPPTDIVGAPSSG
ncbi:MAG: hypothetical protein GXY65_10295 [Rhodococcus sp.]|uniref:hypothetical protein n=1 Tax=Rhodococcus TaxID=1827 RepID=UPI0016A9F351|nr:MULTISPECIES: hypothetical protein [Rhodococcus]NLV79707.1 hypothetical protein [Rhodococcus sp. (in: high G+C Gram-positive bacteria)]